MRLGTSTNTIAPSDLFSVVLRVRPARATLPGRTGCAGDARPASAAAKRRGDTHQHSTRNWG